MRTKKGEKKKIKNRKRTKQKPNEETEERKVENLPEERLLPEKVISPYYTRPNGASY